MWTFSPSYTPFNEFLPSGISRIRLVDFDYVTLSSLNRHATAGASDVGTPKVKCIEKALKQFAKWVQVDSRIEIWRKEEGGSLLEGADWVIGGHTTLMLDDSHCGNTFVQMPLTTFKRRWT